MEFSTYQGHSFIIFGNLSPNEKGQEKHRSQHFYADYSSAESLGGKWTFSRLPHLFYSDYFDNDKLLCHRAVLDNFNYFYCALIVYCRCILKVDISWQLDAGVFISSWTSYASTSSLYFGQPKRNLTIENVCLKLHK